MNDKLISKSKRSPRNTIIISIGILLFSFFIFLLNNNFQPKNKYEEDLKLIGFLVLASVIFYCFYYLLNQKHVYIYEKYFEIKRLVQTKKYYFSDVTTHFSEYFKGEYNSWTEYYLIVNTGEKVTLIDSEYSNFYDFYNEIEKRIKENKPLNEKMSQQKFLKYSIICGIISCMLFYFSSYFYDFKKIENSDFVYLSSKLKNDISLEKGRKRKTHFEIQLTDYPNFQFKISGKNYDGIVDDDEFLKKFKKGNIMTVGVEKNDYEKKIAKNMKLNLFDKYMNFSLIRVSQVKDEQNEYLIDLTEVNRLKKQNNYIGIIFFSLSGILFLYLTFGNYKAFKNQI